MNRASRRAGVTLAAVAVGSVGAISAFLWFWMQPVSYGDLTPEQAAEIRQLRSDVGADNATLAALDLSAGAMETALADLRGWYTTNAATWRTARQGWVDTEARIRAASSLHAQGEDQRARLTTLRATLATQKAAYNTLCATARLSMDNLPIDARAQMALMALQRDVALPFRALELTDQQRTDLKRLRSRYHQSLTGKSTAERAQLASAHEQALTTLLGAQHMATLAGMRSYLTAASERAVTASALVLPTAGEAEPNEPAEQE
ncbi:MAG: hypothetical protein KDA32_07145 [Phycisphaerales bacterium]|nr:hypothetical protein [Phycisphaerales bacterium]